MSDNITTMSVTGGRLVIKEPHEPRPQSLIAWTLDYRRRTTVHRAYLWALNMDDYGMWKPLQDALHRWRYLTEDDRRTANAKAWQYLARPPWKEPS